MLFACLREVIRDARFSFGVCVSFICILEPKNKIESILELNKLNWLPSNKELRFLAPLNKLSETNFLASSTTFW